MKTSCVVCGVQGNGRSSSKSHFADSTSQTVCERCLPSLVADLGIPMEEFLDTLAPPILLVSAGGAVVTANAAAEARAARKMRAVAGSRIGEVIGCAHAEEPGGCGQTVHCKSCTIRWAVTTTVQTGLPVRDMPAYADIGLITGDKHANCLVSTMKHGDFVLLKIS